MDKVLGDGIMITFGTRRADPLDPLNAVRTAVLCQDTLLRLRQEGKTYFKMGIAIHYGRVYIARFIEDEESVQTTVIGRNVNLAGRLSSAAKKPMDEDERRAGGDPGRARDARHHRRHRARCSTRASPSAATRSTQLGDEPSPGARGRAPARASWSTSTIRSGGASLFRYAGDAKFKGVSSSFPVYEVSFGV